MERYRLLYNEPVSLVKTDDTADDELHAFMIDWWSTSMRLACINSLLYGSILGLATLASTNIGWYFHDTNFSNEIRSISGGTMLILYSKDLFPRLFDRGEEGSHRTYLWFANVLGFNVSVLLFGLLNGNILEHHPNKQVVRPIDSIGYFADFLFDGLLIGILSAKTRPKCAFDKPLVMTFILAIDNIIDGLAVGSDVEDSVSVYSVLFFITVTVAAQFGVLLRTVPRKYVKSARILYAFVTGLVTTAVIIDALAVCKHGFTIWVSIGCLIGWTTLHVVERIA